MPLRDLALALVVILVWGMNFVVIKVGLHGIPPMLLGGMRFLLAAVPAIFFVKRPAIPLRWLVAYGATISLGQFAFLFTAMAVGMPAGLASVVLQAQAFFTVALGALLLREPFRAHNAVGLMVAAAGLALIGAEGGAGMTTLGFVLTLCAALMWGLGNIATKKAGKADMLGLVVWGSLVPPLPFFALSWWLEGPDRIHAALASIDGSSVFAVVYLSFVATLVGYGLWAWLMSRYPAAQVAPFSLLIPVIGLAAAAALLGEMPTAPQVGGAVLVMVGLLINTFGRRRGQRTVSGTVR
ncbi:O-acetylserine/cysteine exporter [Bordetella genomosp. 9]|uniref:O-acetylserine/cysteine exporter n=1 Tax=Bordetella genomosp. 9 TaxID=1416803 RepID=A0A261RFU2_9BORD|nr:EamA family transporter [Bordetella genomosp. 9]OZI23183.1 O-acetylserine/cysteine exporter [Bordetella genomosp. 9]